MPASGANQPQVKWLTDLHGLVDGLSTGNNAKIALLDAIKSGEMKVIGSAGPELQAAYPDLWPDFANVVGRKYVRPIKADHDLASHLQQMHKGPIIGGIPSYDQFLAVAMCARLKCRLVTAGKAHKRAKAICKNSPIDEAVVATLSDV